MSVGGAGNNSATNPELWIQQTQKHQGDANPLRLRHRRPVATAATQEQMHHNKPRAECNGRRQQHSLARGGGERTRQRVKVSQ
jgi:hypothetical protein